MEKNRKTKDFSIAIIAVLIIGALLLMLIPIASPIINKNRFETYREDITKSFSASASSGKPITAVVNADSVEVDEGTASSLYSLLMNFGMGNKVNTEPDCTIRMTFPDGAELRFGESEITSGARAGRQGLFIGFKNSEGKDYSYLSDLGTIKSIESILVP